MILLFNVDQIYSRRKLPNLALEKIRMFYESREEIEIDLPFAAPVASKIFASCIFSWNLIHALKYERYGAVIGGTGYDIKSRLPDEIESMKPRINYGFTSRGCPKRCSFCIVHEKEGVGDIYDLWDGKAKKLTLYDNNILSLPGHFKKICYQLKKENLSVDFNQGLDMDYLNPDNVELLKGLKWKELRFAWDSDDLSPARVKKIKDIHEWFGKCCFYVLAGNCTWSILMKKLAFLMRLENVRSDPAYITLAQWTSMRKFFNTRTFKEFYEYKRRKLWVEEQ